jgi:predicted CXXCH cytochrome family protein
MRVKAGSRIIASRGEGSMKGRVPVAAIGSTVVAVLLFAGCVETERVFVEVPSYENPPSAAAGFLGYTNSSSKLPVCGNCHIGQHAKWQNTAHANAWDDLQASGHATESCEGCHSVGSNGNFVTDALVGYAATRDERYHDVQCESCHGPGLEHVTNPDATQPLASLLVGTGLANGCGECHQGTHTPFIEEWSASRHSNTGNSASTRAECASCHEARGIFAAWGLGVEYIERTDPGVIPITCAVCHDPHDARNPKQLRFPIDVPNVETNLCMKCHHKRATPDAESNSRAPHSPQGPLLIGEDVGWVPPNFQYPTLQIVGTHGTEANPRLCATCHVTRLEVTDAATGNFVFQATGHLFKAIPCLDAQGLPTTDDSCDVTQRSFAGCAASGCHTETSARSALVVARTRIASLTSQVTNLLAQVPASEFVNNDYLITTAEGARFNRDLGDQPGSAIHNPFLVEALLTASIVQLRTEYGLTVPADLVLENVLGAAIQ